MGGEQAHSYATIAKGLLIVKSRIDYSANDLGCGDASSISNGAENTHLDGHLVIIVKLFLSEVVSVHYEVDVMFLDPRGINN